MTLIYPLCFKLHRERDPEDLAWNHIAFKSVLKEWNLILTTMQIYIHDTQWLPKYTIAFISHYFWPKMRPTYWLGPHVPGDRRRMSIQYGPQGTQLAWHDNTDSYFLRWMMERIWSAPLLWSDGVWINIIIVWLIMIVESKRQYSWQPGAWYLPLQWHQNGRDGLSNHQPHDCLLNRLFRRRPKKTSNLRVTGLCEGNSPVTGEFSAQRASSAENVSIWWRHPEFAFCRHQARETSDIITYHI